MNRLLNDYLVPILTVVALVIDLFTRFFPTSDSNFLFRPFFQVNLLEILVLAVIVWYGYRFIPSVSKKLKDKRRAKRLLGNWRKFKSLLERFYLNETDSLALQREYTTLRDEIERDFNYFLDKIIEIQKKSHRNYQDTVLRNFEACWGPRNIQEWKERVRRQIPHEVDCFDYILVGLVQYFEK